MMATAREAVVRRVKALLIKAESTASEPEALALTAKANELIETYALVSGDLEHRPETHSRTWEFHGAYAIGWRRLVTRVGDCLGYAIYWPGRSCHRVRVWTALPEQLDLVQSLVLQATTSLVAFRAAYALDRSNVNGYLFGFGCGAADAIEQRRYSFVTTAPGGRGDLVLANVGQRLKTAAEAEVGAPKAGRSIRLGPGFYEGHQDGLTADVGQRSVGAS